MSKNKKAGKKNNPNRPRSKNNPVGKRNDPQIDWAQYNRGRRAEGQLYIKWMRKVADKAREIMGIPKGVRDWRVSAILVAIVKSEEDLSYWGLVKHFDKHPEDLERCELYRPYSRAQYQLQVSRIKPKVQQQIITWMAGEDAVHGTKIADASGYSIARYKEWQNAKYGKLSVKDFAKLHVIRTLHGKICAAMVTPGHANDSPYLRKMIGMMPPGSGDVLGDAIYGGVKNCNAIRDSGRRPIIDPKSNAIPSGDNARAEMLRFRDEHPRTFHNILRARNTYVNPVWSAEFSLASSTYLLGGIWAVFLNLSKTNANFVRIVWYWIIRNIPGSGFPAAHHYACAASPNVSFCEGGDLIPSLAFCNKNIRTAPRCAGRMVPPRRMME